MENLIDEFILFSDHHSHPFTYGAKLINTSYGEMNSRLWDSFAVLREIIFYADDHRIKRLFFGGDLFHSRGNIPTDALFLMGEFFAGTNKEIYLLPGNHDYSDRAGCIHPLRVLPNMYGHVLDWDDEYHCFKSIINIDNKKNYRIAYVPYTDDKNRAIARLNRIVKNIDKRPTILLAHLGIQGAQVGSDYVLVNDSDLSVPEVPWQNFTSCFFGHYHKHQKVFDNGWYIGATHAHNWGDVNQKRGFLHVKLWERDGEFSTTFHFIETNASKFIQCREDELAIINPRPKDFVRIITDRQLHDTEISAMRQAYGSNLEVIPVPTEVSHSAIELNEENLDPMTMVDSWVKANEEWLKKNLPDGDQEELVKYGKNILSTVLRQK